MSEFTLAGLIGIATLICLFFTRMPVAYVMGVVGFVGYSHLASFSAGLKLLSRDLYSVFSSYGLTLIPLFIFMGYIAFHAGISRRLYDVAYKFLGRVRGGLAMATVAACTAFGALCGSGTATAATMATIGLPEMKRYGYGDALATGSVAAGGGLGTLMPPSVVLIVYGILTEQSIGKLFLAGVMPAVVITLLFCLAAASYCWLRPAEGPKGEAFSWREMLFSLGELWESLVVFIFVMGGLFWGLFTPTKAGAVGSAVILIIVMVQGRLSWKSFMLAVGDTIKTSCMVLMLIAGATIFGHFLALSRIPLEVGRTVAALPWPGWAVMAMVCLIYLVGGCFIDALALIMLTIPIFYPITLNLGYDPIWFGVIIVLVGQMGIITPPVGINAFVVKGIAGPGVALETVFKGVTPFLLALIAGTALMIAFPGLVLWLPEMMQ
jgi:tripartite ATP-independent transporter DctM subunit